MDLMKMKKNDGSLLNITVGKTSILKDPFFVRSEAYISADKETVLSRQALFADILKVEGLADFLLALSEKTEAYSFLSMSANKTPGTEESLYRILYPKAYLELVTFLNDGLSPLYPRLSSEALKQLCEAAEKDIESEEFRRIRSYYEKNSNKLRSVTSVTIGVNLDAVYQPLEAGVLSLNDFTFKSGDLFDRILKLDFEKDDRHTIAPLTVIDKKLGFQESQLVNAAVLKAMGAVLEGGLQHFSSRTIRYTREKLEEYAEKLEFLPFVADAIKRIRMLQEKKLPLCFPTVSPDRSIRFDSLYPPALCRLKDKRDIIPNTVELSRNICCYLLTGPNSGGKTVFLNSLAEAQLYFQLGMPIPAKGASLPICDAICFISAEEQSKTASAGRFERECMALSEVLKRATANSLVLIDEAFTATSSIEALPIAKGFLRELCGIGGKCVFVTHYHELCEEGCMGEDCRGKIGYLHTKAQGDIRSYAVQSGKAECGSYARSIAERYGLMKRDP